MKLQRRPKTCTGAWCSTPTAANVTALLGHTSFQGIAFSPTELRAAERLYGFDIRQAALDATVSALAAWEAEYARVEDHNAKAAQAKGFFAPQNLPLPLEPDYSGAQSFAAAGATRNLFRHAESDGLRMVAVIARFLDPGEDPVRLLCRLLADAGYDVGEDPAWYDALPGEGEEEEEK